jgi:hypothetical protein
MKVVGVVALAAVGAGNDRVQFVVHCPGARTRH